MCACPPEFLSAKAATIRLAKAQKGRERTPAYTAVGRRASRRGWESPLVGAVIRDPCLGEATEGRRRHVCPFGTAVKLMVSENTACSHGCCSHVDHHRQCP